MVLEVAPFVSLGAVASFVCFVADLVALTRDLIARERACSRGTDFIFCAIFVAAAARSAYADVCGTGCLFVAGFVVFKAVACAVFADCVLAAADAKTRVFFLRLFENAC